jgi:alkanesulfonate monooxygenase SsuD/methylene tetrahydromethanopterin reductase-like flavin-dependent oxidoreductase (luciferase family)
LRLGMFMMPLHPAGRPMHAYLAEDTEKALLLEKLGFDELFIGEHFTAATEPYPSPLMFAASLLPRTERLVFGTGITAAPLRHPALIAAEAAQFDHMSKGRFILGIGSGSTPTDNEMLGVTHDQRERGRILVDSVEMIEKIWASEPPYDIQGKYWKTVIKETFNPNLGFGWLAKPYQKGGPPIVIPSSSADSPSVKIAASKGWGVITSQLIDVPGVANHWKMFREGCQDGNRPADPNKWRLCRSIFVAATDEEARARVYSAESGYRHFFGHMHKVYTMIGRLGILKSRPDMRDDEVTVDTFIDKRLIFGSPKTVLAELIKLRRETGPFGSLLLTAVDWAGPNAAWERESLTRLVEEVMPAFRAHEAAAAA